MPELPEVETVRRGLASRLSSFQIHDVEILRDRAIASPGGSLLFTQALKGTWVGQWHRRGKYLYADLHDGPDQQQVAERGHWGVHLRMTGQFLWLDEATEPCRHTRVRFWDPEGRELRFIDMRSFGEMWWVPPEQPLESVITGLRRLGPEPFSDAFNGAYLQQRLKKSKRSIKAALLDQSLVAGAGNIYADESLFAAGIAPHTAAGQLKRAQLDELCTCLVDVLQKLYEKEAGEVPSISPKAAQNELKAYFQEVLPDYDEERVYASDIKKIIQWYNILAEKAPEVFTVEVPETTAETDE